MSREIKELNFIEGLNTVAPDQGFLSAGGLTPFANVSDYLTAKGTGVEVGDTFFNTTTNEMYIYGNSTWVVEVDTTTAQTLTNKTIDGDDNTIQDLGISVFKVDASATNVFLQRDASGAVINTKAVPAGAVVGTSDTQTLTGKTMDGDDNTFQDLPLTAIKTVLGSANTFLSRDGSGVPISTKVVPTGTVLGTTDTQTVTNKTFDDAITIKQVATPSNPSAGYDKIYAKIDGKVYRLLPSGVEFEIGGNPKYASPALYITAKGTGAEEGDQFYDTTKKALTLYSDGKWERLGATMDVLKFGSINFATTPCSDTTAVEILNDSGSVVGDRLFLTCTTGSTLFLCSGNTGAEVNEMQIPPAGFSEPIDISIPVNTRLSVRGDSVGVSITEGRLFFNLLG